MTSLSRHRPSPFATLTAASLALLVLSLLWSLADPRLLEDAPVWAKPAKFALSLVVHFGTLALIASALSAEAKASRLLQGAVLAMSAAFCVEMGYMIVQAAQGEASHFNTATPFHAAMYAAMGVGAVTLIAAPLALAWVARRDAGATLGAATRSGIWWGAWVSFGLTMVVAGTLSSGTGHYVGTPSEGAAVIPLFGWSAEVGDLRPSHFLSLHALQALPLLGLWLDRRGRSAGMIPWAAALWGAVTLAVFAQALMGLPLIRL